MSRPPSRRSSVDWSWVRMVLEPTGSRVVISYDSVLHAGINRVLTKAMVSKGFERVFELAKILEEIARDSGLRYYPPVIVLPEARVVEHREEALAILYANLTYRVWGDRLQPVIETYLPLLLYGKSQVLRAIFVHELLHYIYLAIKYLREEHLVTLDIYTSSLSGKVFIDEVYQVRPEMVFTSSKYIRLMNDYDKIISRSRIAYSIRRNWIEKGKPTKKLGPRDMRVNLSMEDWASMYFPESVLARVREYIDEYVG